MKKIILLVVLAAMSQGVFLFAQQPTFRNESDVYFFNFTIERVYTHRLGYVVVYRNNANRIARTYLPREWFASMGGRGAIAFLSSGREWPSMSVFYRDGEFSHVLLRLRRNRGHETWSVFSSHVNIDDRFNLDEIRLQF